MYIVNVFLMQAVREGKYVAAGVPLTFSSRILTIVFIRKLDNHVSPIVFGKMMTTFLT